jgi:hypothetical protein
MEKNGFSTEKCGMRGGKTVKQRTAALLLSLAFFSFHTGRGAATQTTASKVDPAVLWQKALELFRKNSDTYPKKITVLSEVLDRHSQPDSVTQMSFTLDMDAEGRLVTQLVRAVKNGNDISEEMRKKVEIRDLNKDNAPEKRDSLTVSLSDSPFNPDRQKNVSIRASDERRMLFGRTCRRFDFTYRTEILRKGEAEQMTWVGMAWLEEASGMPLKLEFSLEPLPKRIRSLWTIYLYDLSPPGIWALRKITIAGQGGFLFIKKDFRSTTVFSDYRRQSQGGVEQ